MSPFEFIFALVSIVVGLGITDMAASLHRLLRAHGRVRWDWLPLVAATLVALTVLQFWWSFYAVGRGQVWQVYGQFLPLLVVLVALTLVATAALPDEVPAEGLDLAAYYRTNAPYLWTVYTVFLVLTISVGLWLHVLGAASGRTLHDAMLQQVPNAVVALFVGSLAIVRRRAYHAIMVPLLLVVLGAVWSRLRLDGAGG